MTMATSLRTQKSEVETLITNNADKSCDKIINDIKLEFNSLKTLLQRSSISHDHQVQQLLEDLRTSLARLMLTDKAPQSPVVSTAGRVITPQQVNLPKLALPVFHGDPMKWAVFWERFQASVHNNDNLEPSHKLTYLQEAIKDPAASPLLYSSSSSPTQ